MRKNLFQWLVMLAGLTYIAANLTDVSTLLAVVRDADGAWLLLACVLQLLVFVGVTYSYRAGFHLVGIAERLRDLLPITFATLFVNLSVPVSNAGTIALFAEEARRRGHAVARATAAAVIVAGVNALAFSVLLVTGLAYLFAQQTLRWYEVGAAALLLSLVVVNLTLMVLAWRWPSALARMLNWLHRTVNTWLARLRLGRYHLDDAWPARQTTELTGAVASAEGRGWALARVFLATLVAHTTDALVLYACLRAFGLDLPLGAVVATFAIGTLYNYISITPQGVGMVEAVMTLVLVGFGVDATVAALVVLVNRGVSIWLPLPIGIAMTRRIKTFNPAARVGQRVRAPQSTRFLLAGGGYGARRAVVTTLWVVMLIIGLGTAQQISARQPAWWVALRDEMRNVVQQIAHSLYEARDANPPSSLILAPDADTDDMR